MYPKNFAVISLVLIALFFVNSVISFNCYTCASHQDRECMTDPVQDKFITECSPTGIRKRGGIFMQTSGDIYIKNFSMGTSITDDMKIVTSDGTNTDVTVIVSGDVSNITNIKVSSSSSSSSSSTTITHTTNDPASIKWACAKMVTHSWNYGMVVVRSCVPSYARCRPSRLCRCYLCKTELCNSAESPTLTLGMFAVLGVVGIYSTM